VLFRSRTAAVSKQFELYGVIAAGIRTHAEASLVWHSWYLGPIALAIGIAGIALLVRDVLRGSAGPNGFVVAVFLAVGAVYLWKPNVLPDHIWVMRRFFPFILPCFVLFAFVVIDRLLLVRGRSTLALVARGSAVVLIGVAIAWPLASDWPVRNDSSQHGFLASIDRVCHTLGPSAAVVILQGGRLDQVLPQAVRSYCNVPVALASAEKTTFFPVNHLRADFAREPAATRHTLFVVADSLPRIDNIFPLLKPVAIVRANNRRVLEKTISSRPDRLVGEHYRIVIAKVPPPHRT